jgi:hypothetical protein
MAENMGVTMNSSDPLSYLSGTHLYVHTSRAAGIILKPTRLS